MDSFYGLLDADPDTSRVAGIPIALPPSLPVVSRKGKEKALVTPLFTSEKQKPSPAPGAVVVAHDSPPAPVVPIVAVQDVPPASLAALTEQDPTPLPHEEQEHDEEDEEHAEARESGISVVVGGPGALPHHKKKKMGRKDPSGALYSDLKKVHDARFKELLPSVQIKDGLVEDGTLVWAKATGEFVKRARLVYQL